MQTYKINFNKHQNGFYSRYGATSINRTSNLYKNGKTKGKNTKETGLEKQVQFKKVFLAHNSARKPRKVNLYG